MFKVIDTCQIRKHDANWYRTGHINHSLFWQNLAPKSAGGGEKPSGELLSAIEKQWGSFDNFVTKFNAAAAGVQGKHDEIGYARERKQRKLTKSSPKFRACDLQQVPAGHGS